jgi:hypothetical protein
MVSVQSHAERSGVAGGLQDPLVSMPQDPRYWPKAAPRTADEGAARTQRRHSRISAGAGESDQTKNHQYPEERRAQKYTGVDAEVDETSEGIPAIGGRRLP